MKLLKNIFKEVVSFLIMFAIVFAVIKVVHAYVVEPFSVQGRSMEYTLRDGERMFTFKLTDIERFDIIIFPAPNKPEENQDLYVKRVIGMPGDQIEYRDGQLIINGQALKEPYLETMESEVEGHFTNNFTLKQVAGEETVPEGKLFVLGDNRRNSLDGRSFGFIDEESVIGEANLAYWPLDSIRFLEQYQLSEDGSAIIKEK